MIPANGFLPPTTANDYPPLAVPAPEPIAGTYRDYAGDEPVTAVVPLGVTDARSGAHVLGGLAGYGESGQATLRCDIELHEVFGVALLDVLAIPAFGPPSNPQADVPRPASVFAADAARPATVATDAPRPATAWGE